jgi:hypothetical protein
MGGGVSGEEASVQNPRTELFETATRWTFALWDSSCRFFGDFRDLAAFEKFQ